MTDPTPCPLGHVVPGAHAIAHPAGSRCPGCRPRTTMRGTTVCRHCVDVFRASLRDLHVVWPDLATGVARPRKVSTAGGEAVQSSNVGDAGDYWRPQVTDAMTSITEWLEYVGRGALYASPVVGLRGIRLDLATPELALSTMAYNAGPILLKHPQVAEALVSEARRLRDRAHASLSQPLVRRIPLRHPAAKCIIEIEHDAPGTEAGYRTERCGGDLVATIEADDSRRTSKIRCSRYPEHHDVPRSAWPALADALAAAAVLE